MPLFHKFHRNPQLYDERDSVAENLKALLTSRRGFASPLRELGLTDIAGMESHRAASAQAKREIRSMIERYEPRLQDVEVTVDSLEKGRHLRVSLSGTLKGLNQVFYIDLDPRKAGGQVS